MLPTLNYDEYGNHHNWVREELMGESVMKTGIPYLLIPDLLIPTRILMKRGFHKIPESHALQNPLRSGNTFSEITKASASFS
jgi:hypothetical protein